MKEFKVVIFIFIKRKHVFAVPLALTLPSWFLILFQML